MGKGFRNNKIKLTVATLLSIILLAVLDTYASYREFELFDQGYEYYLSYQPEKAVEEFRTFLKEFPNSSAKDAAMFWLGKSLIHLKSVEEAKKVFSEIKQQFPESPFILYVDRESEKISRAESGANKVRAVEGDAVKAKNSLEAELVEVEKKTQPVEKDLSKAPEDSDKLRLEEEKKNTEEMKARVKERNTIYSLHVGLFKNKANASALTEKYRKKGYDAFMQKSTTKDKRKIFYRVLIGKFENEEEASKLAKIIRAKEKINIIIFHE